MRKNKRLFIMLKINIALWLLSVISLDSESIIPIIVFSITTLWLLLFTIANTRG
jgi:hypothetical protein